MSGNSGMMLPIYEIANKLGIPDEFLEPYGKYTAKIKLDFLLQPEPKRLGKLILVTAITPTEYGEGKTVTSIGLAQALEKCGKKSVATLREPSLGPVFGVKGGATGGGKSKVHPSEMINLHFNGDFHAVTTAHNLLAALVDSHLYYGNEMNIDPDTISWPRTIDMNDRVLKENYRRTRRQVERRASGNGLCHYRGFRDYGHFGAGKFPGRLPTAAR